MSPDQEWIPLKILIQIVMKVDEENCEKMKLKF